MILTSTTNKESSRLRHMEKLSSLSPSARTHPALLSYTPDELNSTKFWGLVEPAEKTRDAPQSLSAYEQALVDKKRKRSHILPEANEHLSVREFMQYFK